MESFGKKSFLFDVLFRLKMNLVFEQNEIFCFKSCSKYFGSISHYVRLTGMQMHIQSTIFLNSNLATQQILANQGPVLSLIDETKSRSLLSKFVATAKKSRAPKSKQNSLIVRTGYS